jgi:hypothetical protein
LRISKQDYIVNNKIRLRIATSIHDGKLPYGNIAVPPNNSDDGMVDDDDMADDDMADDDMTDDGMADDGMDDDGIFMYTVEIITMYQWLLLLILVTDSVIILLLFCFLWHCKYFSS